MKHDHSQFPPVRDMTKPASLPSILIRRPDQAYVGASRYEQEANHYGWLSEGEDLKLLFRLPSGDGYLQAREMNELDAIKGTSHLKHALDAAGLSPAYAGSAKHTVPSVMSQVEDNLFVAGVPKHVSLDNIFIERTLRNSPSRSGSLINLQIHMQYRPHEALTAEQIQLLGLPERADELLWKAFRSADAGIDMS